MFKKILIPLFSAAFIAVFAGAWLVVDAGAQGVGPAGKLRRARPFVGQVTAVDSAQVSIQTLKGEARTFRIDEDTRYRSRDAGEVNLEDVQVDAWIVVVAGRKPGAGSSETPLAKAIILLPADFDPSTARPARGKVTAVDAAAGKFTVEGRNSETVTVLVNAETVYRGGVSGLADLKAGMAAFAVTEPQANGDLLARSVRAGFPKVRRVGSVVSVDAAAGRFRMETERDGNEITVQVNAGTVFRSQGNAVTGLAELQPGMDVLAAGEEQSGVLTASMVAAGELPKFDQRFRGKVTAVSKTGFTVQGRDGQTYTLVVDEQTKFRSRGGKVQSLADLKEGMPVFVGAQDPGDGRLLAQTVLVLQRRR